MGFCRMGNTTTLLPLAILLIAAKLAGAASTRFGMPSVVGQLLAGVVLGPSIFGLFHTDVLLSSVASVGVILLMFMAGVETDLVQMRQVGATALLVACGGVLRADGRWGRAGAGIRLFVVCEHLPRRRADGDEREHHGADAPRTRPPALPRRYGDPRRGGDR